MMTIKICVCVVYGENKRVNSRKKETPAAIRHDVQVRLIFLDLSMCFMNLMSCKKTLSACAVNSCVYMTVFFLQK